MKIAVLIKQVPASNDVAIDPVTHCLIRENTEIPAIFLTARDEETDMLTAFDTGADDYVVKPFSMKVLLKRIEAVRRNGERLFYGATRGGKGAAYGAGHGGG